MPNEPTEWVYTTQLKLDEDDHFGRLLKTAGSDTIGEVTVVEESEE